MYAVVRSQAGRTTSQLELRAQSLLSKLKAVSKFELWLIYICMYIGDVHN